MTKEYYFDSMEEAQAQTWDNEGGQSIAETMEEAHFYFVLKEFEELVARYGIDDIWADLTDDLQNKILFYLDDVNKR